MVIPNILTCQASQANMVVDYKDWQIPLGRRFRCAIKLLPQCLFIGFSAKSKRFGKLLRMHPLTSFSTAQPCTIYQKCNLIILKMLPRRSLKLWMVLRLYGLENLQCYIRNHINLAKYFEGLVAADSRFEVDRPLYVCLYVFLFYTPDWTSFLEYPQIFLIHTYSQG